MALPFSARESAVIRYLIRMGGGSVLQIVADVDDAGSIEDVLVTVGGLIDQGVCRVRLDSPDLDHPMYDLA